MHSHMLAKARRFAATLFETHDALLVPTAPFCPTLAQVAEDPIGVNARLGTFTNFVNLCDLAAIAVPCGHDRELGPMGLTLIGPAWSEGRLAVVADELHRHFCANFGSLAAALPAPEPAEPLGAHEMALFCIGAHMSGLPLNGQVTALGGRYLRDVQTRPGYRLHALGPRPGLLRTATDGAAIAGEVWALPTTAIGTLLAAVPPPLGFGTVELADGPCLGFLAEAAGVRDAPDITRFGGWRAYLAKAPDTRLHA